MYCVQLGNNTSIVTFPTKLYLYTVQNLATKSIPLAISSNKIQRKPQFPVEKEQGKALFLSKQLFIKKKRIFMAIKRQVSSMKGVEKHPLFKQALSSKSVKGAALTFQSIHDIHSSYRLATSMLRISNCITNNTFQENTKDISCFFIDKS